ncbi:hypothetical protein AHF37_05893 [Paragonimus kellicotti]|nr:hypothetical protein AHF37_05893 [Paragonimus kellicotti]
MSLQFSGQQSDVIIMQSLIRSLADNLQVTQLRTIRISAAFEPATEMTRRNAANALPAELRSHIGSSEISHLNLTAVRLCLTRQEHCTVSS